ncbi:hypothetical protein [Pontimicrobium sp. IMCC45349]|uniref:hypothetical protein n=1 Tax=Pontimicrobium sp. IMCC45349 TaxID=3391574 RepID=UPI0039A171B8
MDELELLKKDWNKQGNKFPKLSYDEIYSMILKKSSSIVKWIFIISLLEFVFWGIISFALKDTEAMSRFESYNADNIIIPLTISSYIILGYFFYRFYMNYKNISATDNAKKLMQNILKTRKTVKQYVGFNLIFLFISTFAVLGIQFNKDEEMISVIEQASANGELFKFYAVTILITLLVLAIAIAVILLLYYLIYGILLKRLNKNYNELKKLEV